MDTQIVHFDGEKATPAPQAFDQRQPFRLLADEREVWTSTRRRMDPGISWDAMRERVSQAARVDGERTDRGLGALDRLVVDYDSRGVLHVTEARQMNGALAPGFAPVPLRVGAFRQLATRVKAPSAYLAKLPAVLARACLQHGIASSEEGTGLLRLANGEARALLSGRYAKLDNEEFLDTAERAFVRTGIRLADVRVSAVATGARLVIRCTIPTSIVEVKRGDVVEVGVDLRNGELGNAAGSVVPILHRLVCTNGMVAMERTGKARQIRHIGDPARALEMLEGAIPAALEQATGTMDLFRQSTERTIANAANLFSGGLRLFGLSAAEETAVASQTAADLGRPLASLGSGTVTLFDVVNGMTAYARDLGTDRRLEVERMAGEVLEGLRAA